MQCVSAVSSGLTWVSGFPLEFILAQLMKLRKGFPREMICFVGLQERRQDEHCSKTEEKEGLMRRRVEDKHCFTSGTITPKERHGCGGCLFPWGAGAL